MIVEMTQLVRAVAATAFDRQRILDLLTERAQSISGADGAVVELF